MIRHAENVNMNSSGPFKAVVGQRVSLDNFNVNTPDTENRTSNLSGNRPPAANTNRTLE